MSYERIRALREALELTPENHQLRLILAEMLKDAGELADALVEYEITVEAGVLDGETLVIVGELALQLDRLELASRCLDRALNKGAVAGVAALRAKLDERLEQQGFVRVVNAPGGSAHSFALPNSDEPERRITFADVGGLEDVKKIVHKLIILPLLRPDVYRRYGRQSGGGVLMYGPPGCGKTLLARATAGECDLPFFNVRIEDVLDPYFGVSERNLHYAFETVRSQAPCVLFLDELDAIAYARRKMTGSSGRALVDQLLQELDAIGADNQQVLILAATNAPWDLDDALLRPGRFDRRVFVPPPDEKAREHILKIMLRELPTQAIDLRRIASETVLFSGADLRALIEAAVDLVIDEALESGSEPPLTMKHLEKAHADLLPTTLEWLERAQNYVEFANQDKRYDEVATYLRSREVRSWRT